MNKENTGNTFGKRTGIFNNTNKKILGYKDILKNATSFFQQTESYKELLLEVGENLEVKNDINKQKEIKNIISKFISEKNISSDIEQEELNIKLYNDLVEFSFLTKYIKDKNIEEININSWDDIELNYSDGNRVKSVDKFTSKEHALNVIRRMLKISGAVIDNSNPKVIGHLSKNVRIAVLKSPIVDEDVGISASIRIVNPKKLEKQDFINLGTATKEILDFISLITNYGISLIMSGGTGSGKTTLTDWVLKTIPKSKRIMTIEEGSRELDLVNRDENGDIINSVIHTLTRRSSQKEQDISQEDLIEIALRFHPDYIVVAEVRGKEAIFAVEAARTGHTVITTIHANDCKSTYKRLSNLMKKAVNIDMNIINEEVTEAFPIVIYAKQLDDKSRRITEIMECIIDDEGKRTYQTLYKYNVLTNSIIDGKYVIEGHFEKVNNISESLQYRLRQNGLPENKLKQLIS